MKLTLKIFFLFFLIFGYAQKTEAQKTIEVTYVKSYKNYRDTTNTTPKELKNLEYQLSCNNNEARFEYISGMIVDNRDAQINKRFIGKGGGLGIYYKNLKERENLISVNKYDTDILVIEDFNKYNWTLFKETKKILGYDCFKAIGKYKEYNYLLKQEMEISVEAWYAPSIPIPFGPSGYDGLPGLVLESYRSSFYLTATNINFNTENSSEIERPHNGREMLLDDFNKFLNEQRLRKSKL